MSSIIGIGGSILYVQVLIGLGYPPFVASSTSMFLVVYSATANTISYSFSETMSLSNGFWLSIWSTLGVILGVFGINKIIQRTGRQSIIIFLFSFLLMVSIVCLFIIDTIEFVDDIADGSIHFEFNDL